MTVIGSLPETRALELATPTLTLTTKPERELTMKAYKYIIKKGEQTVFETFESGKASFYMKLWGELKGLTLEKKLTKRTDKIFC